VDRAHRATDSAKLDLLDERLAGDRGRGTQGPGVLPVHEPPALVKPRLEKLGDIGIAYLDGKTPARDVPPRWSDSRGFRLPAVLALSQRREGSD
jgi:hypothetical protein